MTAGYLKLKLNNILNIVLLLFITGITIIYGFYHSLNLIDLNNYAFNELFIIIKFSSL